MLQVTMTFVGLFICTQLDYPNRKVVK